jgi:hypothetical protein
MKSSNQAIKNYIDSLPEERKNAIESLRKIIKEYIRSEERRCRGRV